MRFLEQRQALAEQWHIQGWSSKTAYDPRGIGTGGLGILAGYTQEEVAAIPVLSAEELLAYLEALVSANRADRLYAQQLARVLYSLYVGSQHIIPPIQGEDLSALYQLVQQWFAKESQSCLS